MTIEEAKNIRGAVYIPARAWNVFQMWRDYDRAAIERDLSYAAKLKLNAVRVWLSFDYWLTDRGRMENSFYHLLQTAHARKIKILACLFDCCGIDLTPESLNDTNPQTAVATRSPHPDIVNNPGR